MFQCTLIPNIKGHKTSVYGNVFEESSLKKTRPTKIVFKAGTSQAYYSNFSVEIYKSNDTFISFLLISIILSVLIILIKLLIFV